MIFNKTNNGAQELRAFTGNYYANNDFSKMTGDILLATSEVQKIIGSAVYALAEAAYQSDAVNPPNIDLVPYVQLPIAVLATFNMYRSNDISHEDSGRKVKIDAESEKIPWQWQLKQDDEIQLEKYYKAIDALVAYLDGSAISEWLNSDLKKAAAKLLISNTSKFDFYYPIGQSARMYILLLPFLREVEMKLKRQFGNDWARYLEGDDLEEADNAVLEYLLPAIPLMTMSVAVQRLPLGVIPQGVIRNVANNSDARDTSTAATMGEIKEMSDWMEDAAEEMIEMAKRTRNGETVVPIVPVNSADNKYMRV